MRQCVTCCSISSIHLKQRLASLCVRDAVTGTHAERLADVVAKRRLRQCIAVYQRQPAPGKGQARVCIQPSRRTILYARANAVHSEPNFRIEYVMRRLVPTLYADQRLKNAELACKRNLSDPIAGSTTECKHASCINGCRGVRCERAAFRNALNAVRTAAREYRTVQRIVYSAERDMFTAGIADTKSASNICARTLHAVDVHQRVKMLAAAIQHRVVVALLGVVRNGGAYVR